MSSRNRRSTDEVRRKIINEATRLFLERGYDGMSMNLLNARVGGSKGTIYRQFGNKQQLFTAVLDHVLRDHMKQLDEADYEHQDLAAGLEAIARVTLGTVASAEATGLWRLIYAAAPGSPAIGRLFISHGPAKTFTGVERFFRRHAESGALRCRDPEAAAEYFIAMLLHKPMLYRYAEMNRPPSGKRLAAIARRVSRDFLRMCEAL